MSARNGRALDADIFAALQRQISQLEGFKSGSASMVGITCTLEKAVSHPPFTART